MNRAPVIGAAALLIGLPAVTDMFQAAWDDFRKDLNDIFGDGTSEDAAGVPESDADSATASSSALNTMESFLLERARLLDIPPSEAADDAVVLERVEAIEQTLQAIRVDLKSLSASDNLRAIMEAQDRYREAHGEYLAFERGDEQTWAALGVTLPGPVLHEFRTTIYDGMFTVVAEGNLDDDPFTDLWYGHMREGEYMPGQLTSDALDVDMYPDAH